MVTYHTNVKDMVVIVGALPAGDAMTDGGNIAVPTVSGMTLDRGSKAFDKFAIADKLDSVGAEIGFGVGPQSLEIHGKCLRKDLGLAAWCFGLGCRSELQVRAAMLRAARSSTRPSSSSSASWKPRRKTAADARRKPLALRCSRRPS